MPSPVLLGGWMRQFRCRDLAASLKSTLLVQHLAEELRVMPTRKVSDSSSNHGSIAPFTSIVPLKQKECEEAVYGNYVTVKGLEGLGAPWQLAKTVADEASGIALRAFLLDNSGSTSASDGHVLRSDHLGRTTSLPATRWEEICATAIEQAEWNFFAGISTEFHLLNPGPGKIQEGRDFVTIAVDGDRAQLQTLQTMLRRNGPHGTTPLAARLRDLKRRFQGQAQHGRVMLSVVTDGVPTSDGFGTGKDDFVQQLREFATGLNAFVVIRLATDDDSVVSYYNRIDEELELPLDILDDLKGEAQELHACGNGWFAYTPILHRIREGGSLQKIFDLLDERALGVAEISVLLELLLRGPEDPPFPRQPEELYAVAAQKVTEAPPVFNGRLNRMTDPIDLKMLKKALKLSPWCRLQTLVLQNLICSSKALP